MSTTDSEEREDEYIGARVSPEFKKNVRIRAAQEGLTVSDYIESVLADDIEENL